MTDRDVADELGSAVAQVLGKHGQMATRWVVLVELIDAEGERGLWLEAPDDMRSWDTLGLLDYAGSLERAKIQWDNRDED